jgi:hypothetical protein
MRRLPLAILTTVLASCATEPPPPTHAMPEIQRDEKTGPRQFKQFHSAPVSVTVRSVDLGADTTELGNATRDFVIEQLTASGVQVADGADWKIELVIQNFGHGAANFNGDNCISVVTRVIRPNQEFLANEMKTDRCHTNGQGMFAGSSDPDAPANFPALAKRIDKLKVVRDEQALGRLYQVVMLDVLAKLDR